MASRKEVLFLYRRIIKLGKTWEAVDSSQTEVEKSYILKEAKKVFKQNSSEKDPEKIKKLIEEGEKRITIAQHYRIPYERPEYLPPATSYQVNVAKGKFKNVLKFVHCYYAGVFPETDIIDDFAIELIKDPKLGQVFSSSLLSDFPGKAQFERRVLKSISNKLESKDFYDVDEIYGRLGSLFEAPTFFRIFLNLEDPDSTIIIEEKSEQLSSGTTGLSSWQAAYVLANFVRNHMNVFRNKNILELGAGCGLTGIACAKYCDPASLSLTDCNSDVLHQLKKNIELNNLKNVVIQKLDWMEFDINQLRTKPDIVIAADVVYDPSVLTGLASTLRQLLSVPPTPESSPIAFVACTVRNPSTLQKIKDLIAENSLEIFEIVHWSGSDESPETFHVPRGSSSFPVEILKIKSRQD
ncbi:hypothetical protein FO519_002860 [Halicephalobus sp. NKZ332]|nr:hypothetical protein FO519_002860 [Halicephalobus sp. NKZ332]